MLNSFVQIHRRWLCSNEDYNEEEEKENKWSLRMVKKKVVKYHQAIEEKDIKRKEATKLDKII